MIRPLAVCAAIVAMMTACVEPSVIDSASPEAQPEAQPEGSPEAAPEGSPEAQPEPQPEREPAPEGPPEPEGEPEGQPEGQPEAQPEGQPEGQPEPQPEPEPTPDLPARYRHDALLSPINAQVARSMRQIRERSDTPDDLVFMKVGASGTVNTNLLFCFADKPGSAYTIDLDGREVLEDTLAFFRMGDAAGTTPFDRPTKAARVGQSARWAITGSPSPIAQEIADINPRFAFVNYGTNDMQLGTTHLSALFPFYENYSELLDQLSDQGIIPIITGLNPRTDDATAGAWVPTFDAVVRGVAEARQVPYVNLYLASRPLASQGLLSDGLHGNAFRDGAGRSQPCVLTPAGLAFNYNIRNLLSLEALHKARLTTLEDQPAPDTAPDPLRGAGAPDDPFIIDRLPFTHAASTGASIHQNLDAYPGCDNGQDESGPELTYRLDLDADTDVRMIVLDRGEVDVDIHLLGPEGDPTSCVARNDKVIERRLAAGTWIISLDTFVSGNGTAYPGDYLFIVVQP